MTYEYRRALDAAMFFRLIGLCPLPSRMDKKSPMLLQYAKYKSETVPAAVYSGDSWRTTNVQLLTGAKTPGGTKIVVVDLDGDAAKDTWKRMVKLHGYRATSPWIAKTGSGGEHWYYQIPYEAAACPSRLLWALYDPMAQAWLKHTEVRLLGDDALVVAPPSRHVKTGEEYRWVGKHHPGVFPLPELAPKWLLELPALSLPKPNAQRQITDGETWRKWRGFGGLTAERELVLQAISPNEKLALARSWGLRLTGRSTQKGWAECHAILRDDHSASAGLDAVTGVYCEPGSFSLSFFDLAVRLGVYPDWKSSYEALRRCALLSSASR